MVETRESQKKVEGDGGRHVLGIAEYLEQFDRSPYSYPACDYVPVQGTSTLKGAWLQHAGRGGEDIGRELNSAPSDPA